MEPTKSEEQDLDKEATALSSRPCHRRFSALRGRPSVTKIANSEEVVVEKTTSEKSASMAHHRSLLSGVTWNIFTSKPKKIPQIGVTPGDGGEFQRSSFEKLAPELLILIFSYLKFCELFPLRVVGSHYLLDVIRNYQQPLPSLGEYMTGLRLTLQERKVSDKKNGLPQLMHNCYVTSQDNRRVSLNIAASRGQDSLVIAIMNYYREGKYLPLSDNAFQRSALSSAAEHGHLHTVKLLVKFKERPVWYRDKYGHSALDYAAGNGQIEIVKFLISKGCNITATLVERDRELRRSRGLASRGWMVRDRRLTSLATPLVWAATGGHIEMVKFLISAGVPINPERVVRKSIAHQSDSALTAALSNGNLEIVNLLVEAGALMDTEMLITPLHASITAQRTVMVSYICSKGCPLDKAPRGFDTPLYTACGLGNVEIIEILLDHGASMDQLSGGPYSRSSVLQQAAGAGFLEVVKYLVERGADPVNYRSDHSPLHAATSQGSGKVMRYLMDCGARMDVSDGQGSCPLYAAIDRRPTKALKILLTVGDARAKAGGPKQAHAWREITGKGLVYAAMKNKVGAVEELLKYLPRLDYQDEYGCTAMHYAAIASWTSTILTLLLSNGAPMELRDRNGCTPLLRAALAKRDEMMVALISAGADTMVKDNKGRTMKDLRKRVSSDWESVQNYHEGIGGGCA